jgi:tetratricopeptide (TPR) repeat protein
VSDPIIKYKSHASHLLRYPNDIDTLVNQYALLSQDGYRVNNKHYLSLARRALEVGPDDFLANLNCAGALERTGRYQEALTIYWRCMDLAKPEFMPQVLHDIGVCYRGMGDNEKAIEFYDHALELDPRPVWKRDRSISMMAGATMGTRSLVDGLKAFESRRECAEEKLKKNKGVLVAQQRLPAGVVHWQGEKLKGKTVVVYHEEGAGDFIQFCRFIPWLYDLGAEKIFVTGTVPKLLEVATANLFINGIVPIGGPFECDYVVGSMTLPWRLGIEYKDITGEAYFSAVPANIPKRGEIDVGLVWRGNPVYARDHLRSMPFETYAPLFELSGAAFNSLQVGPASTEITNLGFDGFVADLQPFMKTWWDTARVIKALDVVVTVDTGVAHLAGALGKPVFILTTHGCDWRWHRNSDRTAWYQSARVIRQQRQDEWAPCIEEVKCRLREMIDGRRGQTERPDQTSEPRKVAAGR